MRIVKENEKLSDKYFYAKGCTLWSKNEFEWISSTNKNVIRYTYFFYV